MFSLAEGADNSRRGGIAEQEVAADSFYGKNFSGAELFADQL